MSERIKQLAPILLGSWLVVVGVVTLTTASVPYRAEIPSALAITVGFLMLRYR